MLRNHPKFAYNGLTLILSVPSRNDTTELLSGVPGFYINTECLSPETNIYCCDVRLVDDPSPFYKDTKVIVLLGLQAFKKWTNSELTLDEARGSPFIINDIVCIPTFGAQDSIDLKDFESKFNEHLKKNEDEDEFIGDDDNEDGDVFESKGRGKTKRKNYRFWLKQDIKKALRILENDGKIPKLYEQEPTYIIAPDADFVCDRLLKYKDNFMFYDCETDFISYDIRCFAFSFSDNPFEIITVPLLTTDYKPYYGEEQFKVFRALVLSIQSNTLVAHNGDQFDFLVLALLYRIPVRKVYDTLISQHRIYPTIEKSLGHLMSLCTYEMYHKDEGSHGYFNHDQAMQLYKYCGKDVFGMYLVWKWQQEMADEDEGLLLSIKQANDAIIPYETASYLGMHYNEIKRKEWIFEADRLMEHYMKVMRILTGPNVEPLISNQKCNKYFHELLGYPVISKTKTGKPSLGKDNLLKLGLSVDNPVTKFLIRYRETQKESGILNFNPWITINEQKEIAI